MTPRQARDIPRILNWFLPLINRYLDEQDRWRKGGWLYIAQPDGSVFFHEQVGEVKSQEKSDRYRKLSAEKALRLRMHPDHRTSWQSRNPDQDQWDGAVRTHDDWIFGFSGLTEAWDIGLLLAALCFHDREICDNHPRIASPEAKPLVGKVLTINARIDADLDE